MDNDTNVLRVTNFINNYSMNDKINRIIYLTNTNWILDATWNTLIGGTARSLEEVNSLWNELSSYIHTDTSHSGTWGMQSKLDSGIACLENWAQEIIISNAKNGLDCLHSDFDKATKIKILHK